jgi:heterodisulfide reductase subunit C
MENERLNLLMRRAGVQQYDCYQCGKCSGGCPMAHAMDLKPRGVMRCAQTGSLNRILESNTIWLCTGCHTCVERCPHDVDVPALIEEMRYEAAATGHTRRDSEVLNKVFLANIRMFGKNHEMLLAGLYNIFTLKPLQDVKSLPHMYRNKMLKLLPKEPAGMTEIEKLVERAEKWRIPK